MTISPIQSYPKPFLKWAGGKTQLISVISPLIQQLQAPLTYIEPFVGGGAILFHVLSKFPVHKAIINDLNLDLVTAYKVVKNQADSLIEQLENIAQDYHLSKSRQTFYLTKREQFNQQKLDPVSKTALLIFLNRTCFNGLYRVNSKGLFNVPFGNYVNPKICDRDNLLAVAKSLQQVEILQGDFTKTLAYQGENTLFYLDPPYKPINTTSAFTAYSKENFGDFDQIRLKQFCDRINDQGGKFILSNSDPQNYDPDNTFFQELYTGYQIMKVKARRNINSKGEGRGQIDELMITNFS